MKYTEEQLFFSASLWSKTMLINDVLERCGLKKGSEDWIMTREVLREAFRKRVIYAVWVNIRGEYADEFTKFVDGFKRRNPELDSETAALQFASTHLEVREKVFDDLQDFIDDFVKKHGEFFEESK
jgi:hypothetical protein